MVKSKRKSKKKKKNDEYYVDDLIELIGQHLAQYPMSSVEFYANQIINDAKISYQGDGFFEVEWQKE